MDAKRNAKRWPLYFAGEAPRGREAVVVSSQDRVVASVDAANCQNETTAHRERKHPSGREPNL